MSKSNTIQNIDNIAINKNTYEYKNSTIGKKLKSYNIIENIDMKYMDIKVKKDNTHISTCRVCKFNNNVNYIQSIEVFEDFQGNGIGSDIFKHIIYNILSIESKIYINPTNKIMKIICKKHNFKPINKPEGWFINN